MKKSFFVFLLALSASFFCSELYAANPTPVQEAQYSSNNDIRSYYVGKLSPTGIFTISLPSGLNYVGCSANLRHLGGLQFSLIGPQDPGSYVEIAQIATKTSSGGWVYFTIYADVD